MRLSEWFLHPWASFERKFCTPKYRRMQAEFYREEEKRLAPFPALARRARRAAEIVSRGLKV